MRNIKKCWNESVGKADMYIRCWEWVSDDKLAVSNRMTE